MTEDDDIIIVNPIECPCCGELVCDPMAIRGILTNEVAKLGARIVELTLRLRLPFITDAARKSTEQRLDETIAEHDRKGSALRVLNSLA